MDSCIQKFKDIIQSDEFPCVGAKSALAQSNMYFYKAKDMGDDSIALSLYEAVKDFGKTLKNDSVHLQSFVVIFDEHNLSEKEFEKLLWQTLQSLHDIDAEKNVAWSRQCDSSPESPHFSMSVAGQAYFIVGLHPRASREARQMPFPVMVFNSHEQFEALRESGKFQKMQTVIRKRDESVHGNINPMLDNYGELSEALQYSGRKLPSNWKCPLQVRE